jgi:hypothetical protein
MASSKELFFLSKDFRYDSIVEMSINVLFCFEILFSIVKIFFEAFPLTSW